ncbi:MAG: tail fiber protein [Desulfobacterales bacterium]|nr:tail fiber protein [Desulfobacterales bacterium]
MSEPFLAEIRIVGFNFAPRGWAFCDGQILPINQNQSLYSLLGTTYGGDGRTSFALPDLRSRVPIHVGDGHTLGQKSGAETITLTAAEIAAHTHSVKGTSATGDARRAGLGANRCFATTDHLGDPVPDPIYGNPANMVAMNQGILPNTGGGQAHNNMQPYLTLAFCIALRGLFPSRN